MAMEYELAGIIRFVLDATGNPAPYYWRVPEDFVVPAAYFPIPEIISYPDTLLDYRFEYAWYIKLFAHGDVRAHQMGLAALSEIRKARNLIPVIDEKGEVMEGRYIRTHDPDVRLIDDGVCQLTITWASRRPYNIEVGPEIKVAGLKAVIKTQIF